MVLKELTGSLNDMEQLLELKGKNSEIYFDHQCLNAIKISSMSSSGS